jgi:hypothetical protein
LNISCNFLYCNHQVHRDFLITVYKNLRGDDMTANLEQCNSLTQFTVVFMSVAMDVVPSSNLCPMTRFTDHGIFLGLSEYRNRPILCNDGHPAYFMIRCSFYRCTLGAVRFRLRIPAQARVFSLPRKVPPGSGAHPVSYSMVTQALSLCLNQTGHEVDLSSPSSVEV